MTNAQIRRHIVRRYMENGGQLLLQARLGDSAMVALGFSGDCQVHLITKRCPHEPGILTVHHSTPIQNVSAGPRLPSILKSSRMHHGYGVNLGTTSIESVLQHLDLLLVSHLRSVSLHDRVNTHLREAHLTVLSTGALLIRWPTKRSEMEIAFGRAGEIESGHLTTQVRPRTLITVDETYDIINGLDFQVTTGPDVGKALLEIISEVYETKFLQGPRPPRGLEKKENRE